MRAPNELFQRRFIRMRHTDEKGSPMIWTMVQTSFRRLRHDRSELLLTFVMPIAFFSIFALIFGGGLGGRTKRIKVVAVDEVNNSLSEQMMSSLREDAGLRFVRDTQDAVLNRQQARQMVRDGQVTIAIVLKPNRLANDPPTNNDAESSKQTAIAADLLADQSDQVAGKIASAIVTQTILMKSLPVPIVARESADSSVMDDASSVQIVDVLGEGKANPVVSMYAAGIAVMFLLFGATGGGGALLEERENETLDRLLTSHLSMDQLLLGKWTYLTILGVVQVSLMFVWGQIVFGIDLLGHLDGFLVITLVTAGAAAAFGLLLATVCRTRGQLNGLSVILVLSMSALGGSMVPRYVMSPELRSAGLWTFNAWALDGYDKVFWRDLPLTTLTPQLAVLVSSGFGFLIVARVLAMRWETN